MSSASRPTPGLLLPARATDTGLGVLACERGGGRSQEGLGPGRLLRLDLVLVRAGWALPTSGAQGRQHAPASLPCRQLSPFLLGSGWQGRLSTWSGGWRKKPVPLARPWASQLAGKTLGSEGGQRELSSRAPRYVQTQKNEYFSAHVFSLPHSIWQPQCQVHGRKCTERGVSFHTRWQEPGRAAVHVSGANLRGFRWPKMAQCERQKGSDHTELKQSTLRLGS